MPNLEIRVTEEESTLTVVVSGKYRYGSNGNQDAADIASTIDAALVKIPTSALIIDLTRMNYEWGDAVGFIFHKYRSVNPTFLLPASQAQAWKGILAMTWPSWTDHLGKELRFIN